jgi:uncharacterized protein YndB with AHSA1/START domain
MWTEPEHLANWWGPGQFTNPRCELDPHPGGKIILDMRGPNGTVYPNRGEFVEVAKPERIVFTLAVLDDTGKTVLDTLNTVTLEAQGEKTKLTVNARVTDHVPEAEPYLKGMKEGWNQTLDRLEERIAEV